MAKTAKEFLADFTAFMQNNDVSRREKSALWDVLTALRGPDRTYGDTIGGESAVATKGATTAVLRDALGLTEHRNEIGADSGPDSTERAALRSRFPAYVLGGDGHFLAHIRRAFEVLGLPWDPGAALRDS
ncbi:MAG TPA: hypothetical protein VF841_17255 [Anaeromyxobacter sp.]